MLETFEDDVTGTMSFVNLTDAIVAAFAVIGRAFVFDTFFLLLLCC
jgi:hypothetical protein